MSEPPPPIGTISWVDLTVPDARSLRDFYQLVVGWEWSEVPMGGYDDYCMNPPGAPGPIAGICHAQGSNADLPPVWLVYITVADLDQSLAACIELGGMLVSGPKSMPQGRYAVIRDPAGAAAALFEPRP